MRDLFFYGTLRSLALLEIVLGRAAERIATGPARLADHAVLWVEGAPYPTIVRRRGATAEGLLVRGLTDTDIDRLIFYEGGFDYALRPVTVETHAGPVQAEMFFPPEGQDRPGPDWSLEEWERRWGPTSRRAAEEVMAFFGRLAPQEIARRFPQIRRRAWCWVQARKRPGDGLHDLARDVEVLEHKRAHLNFFGIEEARLRFRRFDGTMSAPMERSAQMVGDAAVVLPYDPRRDQVLLIQQFRAPVFLAGDPAPWVWEPVAGLVDPGESPEQTARREAVEEAGLTLDRLEPAGKSFASTGSSGEFLHLFIGIADLGGAARGPGGLESEGEDILPRLFSFDALMQMVDRDQIRDMPLLATALWLARHRDRLRVGA